MCIPEVDTSNDDNKKNDNDRDEAISAIQGVLGQFENLFRNMDDVLNGFPKKVSLEDLEGREQYNPHMLEENLLLGSPDVVIEKLKRYQATMCKT